MGVGSASMNVWMRRGAGVGKSRDDFVKRSWSARRNPQQKFREQRAHIAIRRIHLSKRIINILGAKPSIAQADKLSITCTPTGLTAIPKPD